MAISYDTLGGEVNVTASGTIPAGDLNSTVAIVGHADFANAADSVTAAEPSLVSSRTDAETTFGENSELAKQAALAFANGAGTVYGIPAETSETTETVTAQSSGSLTAPLSDPRVTTRSISVTKSGTDVSVQPVYGQPESPSASDTIQINPLTGSWEADASADYEFTYTVPTYDTATTAAVNLSPRAVALAQEDPGVITTLQTELATAASDFQFSRGVVGATPAIGPTDVSNYSPTTDSWRIVETAPARGEGGNGAVRTAGAIAGLLASQPIDVTGSVTYDSVSGLIGLNEQYPPSTAGNFERVLALTDERLVANGVTTARETAFADVYKAEIIDLIVEQLYERIKNYRGGSNAQSAQRRFQSRLRRSLSAQSAPTAQPPLLATGDGSRPYNVSVRTGATDSEAEVTVGIDPAPIAKTVSLNVSVGPIQFNGATAE